MQRPLDQDVTDGELIERHRAGDRDAFDVLYRRYQPRLVAFCAQQTRDRSQAEDLAHETLARALAYLHSFDTSRPLWPWLRTIATRVVLASRPRVPTDPWPASDLAATETPPPALVLDDQMNTVELAAIIDRAIRPLPPRQRAALRLLYANDWTATEAGRHMGLRRPAFQQLVLRARRNLKTHLGDLTGVRLGLVLPGLLAVRLRAARDRIRTRIVEVNPAASAFPVFGEVGIQAVGAVAMAVVLTVVGTAAPQDTSVPMQASRSLESATVPYAAATSPILPVELRPAATTRDVEVADALPQEEASPSRVTTVRAPLASVAGRDASAETTVTEGGGAIVLEGYIQSRVLKDDAPDLSDLPEVIKIESETTWYCDGPGAATSCDALWTAADLRDEVVG